MKVYVDISKQCIIKTDDEDRTVFKGDENVDHIKVYFKEMPTQWYLTLGALLPNGRTIPQRLHDGNILTEEVDGTTYYYATFTLSKENGFTLMSGKTLFTLKIHYVNDSNVVIKEKTMGAIAVNVVDSTTDDENILILDGDTAEVVYNMKLAIENMQARLTNYENSFTSNQITARALLSILNDFSSYKVVFGHSYKEDEEDASTRKYYLMAVVNKEENSDVIFGIDKNGRLSANSAYFTNASIFDAAIETLAAAIANIQTLDTANLTASNATIQALEVDNKATIKDLDADTSTIEELNSTNATILKAIINELLSAVKAQIDIAEIAEANITEANVQDIYSDNATISRILNVVGTANIDKLNARFVVGDLIPDADNTRNLGAVLKTFANVFANVVKATDVKIGDYYAITTKDKEELQIQIDGINAGQNLADIVGTFALLSVYDTANLKVNDKVQVLVDETKENDSTVYNWNGTSWEFVGSYGSNSYTKAESDAKHLVLEQRMSQHEKDIAEQFDKHEEEVQEVVDTYKADIENYVDNSIGDIPAILDYLIEVA